MEKKQQGTCVQVAIFKNFRRKSYPVIQRRKSLPLPSLSHRITQNGRGWKGPQEIKYNLPAKAGSPRAGCTGPRPGGFSISPEKDTPQPLWAACSSALSPLPSPLCSAHSPTPLPSPFVCVTFQEPQFLVLQASFKFTFF